MKTDWMALDTSALTHSHMVRHHGDAHTFFFPSPYDVPEAIRGLYDPAAKTFRIEFKYLGEEPKKELKLRDHVDVQLGRNSNRIYGFEFDVSGDLYDKPITDLIKNAIDELYKKYSSSQNKSHYEIAQSAAESAVDDIIREVKSPQTAQWGQ
jgi:hypothetical protein